MSPPVPPPDTAESNSSSQQTDAMNGPSEGAGATSSGDDPLLWERSWSIPEIRKQADNWSLAADSGLLLYLKEFSQHMISRTHEVEKDVTGLVHEAKLNGVCLHNVFNDFMMLANTQFVENRVYDEDVNQGTTSTETKTEEKEKTREQREAELIPKLTDAVKMGIAVIDKSFDVLEVNVVESESEEEGDIPIRADPILEAKDPYVVRPLPYIIGTPQFFNEDEVGLMDLPSDDEDESSHGSLSESEDEKGSEYSDSDEEDEKDARKDKYKSDIRNTSSEEDSDDSDEKEDDGNLFRAKPSQSDKDSSDDEIGEDDQDERGTTQGNDFNSELAARIGAAIPKPRPGPGDSDDDDASDGDPPVVEPVKKERAESRSKKSHEKEKKEHSKHKAKKKRHDTEEDGDLFGADTDDSPFGKGGGLFSSSKGMFDDDGDNENHEGGLFDDIEEKPAKQEEIVEEKPKVDERKRTKSGRIIPVGAVSIFGAGDESIYAVRSPVASEEDPTGQLGSKKLHDKKVNLAKVEEEKKPVASGLFDSDDDDGDLFSSGSTKSKPTTAPPQKKEPVKKPAVDLFGGGGMDDDNDDDNDDDLFAGNTTVKNETAEPPKDQPPKKKLPAGAVSMFGGAANPLTAALKKQRPASDDEEADDSDADIKDSGSMKSTHSNLSISASATNKLVTSIKKDDGNMSTSASNSSLFAEEPEDDPFLSRPKAESKAPKSAVSSGLFSTDDDDLFGNSQPAKVPQSSSTIATPAGAMETKRQTSILFDDDNDDDDGGEDLFAAVPPTSKVSDSAPAKKKPVGGVSLFGGVDLFGKEDKEEDKVKESIKKEEPPPPRKATLSLFDEDGDDDLFGSGSSAKKTVVEKPASTAAIPKETEIPGKARSKSKRVFDDEDILFGGSLDEEAPKIDLFGSESPLKTKPDKTNAKAITVAKDTKTIPIRDATVASSSTDADLFGDGDDEEEDLFGDGKKSEQKVDIKDVTTSESSTDDVSKRKKLAGAVSLFGGIDPLAGRRKEKEKDDDENQGVIQPPLSEPAKTEDSPKPPAAGSGPLFGTAAPGPLPKFRSGSDIMREAEKKRLESGRKLSEELKAPDTLFGSPERDDLFSKPVPSPSAEAKPILHPSQEPKPVAPPKTEQKPVLHPKVEQKPVPHPKTAPRPAPHPKVEQKPVLHPKVEQKPVPHPKVEQKPVPHPKTEPKPVPKPRTEAKPILHPKSEPKPEPSPETKQKPTDLDIKPGKKPPPGAVSLFGGIDPLASPTRTAKPFVRQSVSPDSDEDLFGAAREHTDSKPQAEHKTSTQAMKGKIGKLQANLAINPAALLPGASPPVVESKEIPINFDEPPAVQTLDNINKDKAKLQPHKRKPSRRARHAAVENAGPEFADTTSPVSSKSTTPSATPRTSPESDSTSAVNKSDSSNSKSTHEVNPLRNSQQSSITGAKHVNAKSSENDGIDTLLSLGMDRNRAVATDDDIFKSAFTKTSAKKSNLITDDDLFSSSSVSAKTSATHKTRLADDDDDLFGGPDIPSVPKTNKVQTKAPAKIDNEDDLFGSGKTKVSKSLKSDKKILSKSQTEKKVPKGHSDDIFSTVTTKPVITENNDMVNDNDDDEDIFADTSVKKKGPKPSAIVAILDKANEEDIEPTNKQSSVDPAKSESTTVLPNGEKEPMPDETADVEARKSKKRETRKTKKAKTKDEDLFKDETDIFADIPASKPKEKKKKKTTAATSSSSAKKSVFSDNVDDIFSSTPAASKSKKQDANKKKTSTKPASADSGADIFEDNSDNIFNDPLSAAGK